MGIKLKNLDLRTKGMQRSTQVTLKAAGSTGQSHIVFVSPVACTIDSIDIAVRGLSGNDASASKIGFSAACRRLDTGASYTLNAGIASAVTHTASDAVAGCAVRRFLFTANASFSTGVPMQLSFGGSTDAGHSAAIVKVNYTPKLHRETR